MHAFDQNGDDRISSDEYKELISLSEDKGDGRRRGQKRQKGWESTSGEEQTIENIKRKLKSKGSSLKAALDLMEFNLDLEISVSSFTRKLKRQGILSPSEGKQFVGCLNNNSTEPILGE